MAKEERRDNNFGIASVVLGIVGSVLGVFAFPVLISVFGLIFGIVQLKKEKNAWAVWGIFLSALGIIISVYIIWWTISTFSSLSETLQTCQANPTAPGCAELFSSLGIIG